MTLPAGARVGLVAAAVALAGIGGVRLYLARDPGRSPAVPARETLASNVDWQRVAAALSLVAEEYAEDLEVDGRLDERRPAMVRRMDTALELVRSAQPPAVALGDAVSGLRARVERPVDYDLPQDLASTVADLEAHDAYPRVPAAAPSLENGAAVYAKTCAPCHGAKADGDSPMAKSLNPPPANLLQPEHNWRPYDMFARVTFGGLETAMPPFRDSLSTSDRWDVVFYLFSQRWPPCDHEVRPVSSSVLAVSSDFDLSHRVPYADMPCVRRDFVGP